jgi:hypothetical protein
MAQKTHGRVRQKWLREPGRIGYDDEPAGSMTRSRMATGRGEVFLTMAIQSRQRAPDRSFRVSSERTVEETQDGSR